MSSEAIHSNDWKPEPLPMRRNEVFSLEIYAGKSKAYAGLAGDIANRIGDGATRLRR